MVKKVSPEEARLTRILYRCMSHAMERMSEVTKDLASKFEQDKARAVGFPTARELLDTLDIGAQGRILDRLDDLVREGLPPALAHSILTRMASHSQGWTMRTAYRFELFMEREALRSAMREASVTILGEAAGESMMKTAFEVQKAQGVAFPVPDYPKRMVEAIGANPHRSMWLLMAKKADGELEVPGTGAMWRDEKGVLRAFTDGNGHRVLPDRIDLRAVSRWMDDVSKSAETDIYKTCMSGIMSGKGSAEIGRDLEAVRDTAPWRSRAMARTMYTETSAQADKAGREKLGIEEYSFVCGLDEKTCPICGDLDGRVFALKDARPGVNYPPMHPNCRCTTVSVPHDEEDGKVVDVDGKRVLVSPGERAGYVFTRDASGNIIRRQYSRVPASMTYPQWVKLQESMSSE